MAYRRIIDSVVVYPAVLATYTDTVRPLLEGICATGSDVVMLNGSIVTSERALREVEARPTAGIVRMYVLDKLVGIRPAHLDVRATAGGRRVPACTVDLQSVSRGVEGEAKA